MHSQYQRNAKTGKKKPPSDPIPASPLPLPLPVNYFRLRPFWLLSFLTGRHSGVVLPSLFLFLFFLNAAEFFLHCSYSPTHIGCLASALKQMDGWGGVFHRKDVHFTTVRKAWIVFFGFVFIPFSFTHTAMAITACTESITANRLHTSTELGFQGSHFK